ncbi:MarR family winged helix-turn-helix transcriptional regulator [uncultured Clostridium sp.]|uniref:MarR family winged helix-turn-helix transcriptional regulator n=1 Tax=uncultured Clostridium sp. TaxID=59620 RepID=UPI0028E7E584|nr:MarR family winged helix-turn-helix transcriptional regulator [uncultured Clostridium sp.]
MSEQLNTELIHKFERIMNKYNKSEKKPKDYGISGMLYRSEVHTIEAIGKNNKINVTQLAAYLGITKGAVSQMIDKLIKKDLVSKNTISETENEVALELTEKGWLVFNGHKEYHKEFYGEISKHLSKLSEWNIQEVLDIFTELENLLDKQL